VYISLGLVAVASNPSPPSVLDFLLAQSPSLSPTLMTNDNSHIQAPEIGVTVKVPRHLIRRSLVEDLRRSLSTSDQEELGNDYMDQSRDLLQRHLPSIEPETQHMIRENVTE